MSIVAIPSIPCALSEDCEIALALADIHEQWSSEDEGFGYDSLGGGRRDWELDEDEDGGENADNEIRSQSDEGPPLIELLDSDIELRHWLDADGRPMESDGFIPMTEVRSTGFRRFPAVRVRARRLHGNWGTRARRFLIRAKMAPA